MGGQISLDSEAGQGTKVSVEMTLVCATPPLAAEPEHSPIGMAALPLRVLVVDDVAANRLVLTQQLEFLGH
ncbi:hypothetical protein NL459_27790, partial [Klebsiella pneumoniae]|nr:hypothetical protein [Klebsiella pneumoniae]